MDEKNVLLDLIQTAYKEELNFMQSLNEDERAVRGTSDHWAVKDVMAHIAAWKKIMVKRFIAAKEDTALPEYSDLDAMNDELFQSHREDSWQEVEAIHEQSYHQLVEQIQLAAEDALVDPERYAWLNGQSLWKRTVHNGYFHPLGHIAQLLGDRGDSARGNQIMEEATRTMLSLDESERWRGQCLYNLACYYALSGEKERAIENLSKAFELSADMVEYSKQDTDLASVWEEPGYHALVDSKVN